MTALETHGFELVDWQREAVDSWAANGSAGVFEIFTGGGKTLLALECATHAAQLSPDVKIAVIVPTEALAHQWRAAIEQYTTLSMGEIGLLGAGGSDTFDNKRVLVCVLNTAARVLPGMAQTAQPLMLVVDECHRAGAPTFAAALDTPAPYRLGLSATPEREELDEYGEPLRFDEQLVGQKIGPVCYRFSLQEARKYGWLPHYEINHHGLELSDGERKTYERLSRQVDDLGDRLKGLGVDRGRAQQLQSDHTDVGKAAKAYVAATSQRKDHLYQATERRRVAGQLVLDSLEDRQRKILLFHERVDQAEELYEYLRSQLSAGNVRLEHSRLSDRERREALAAFRDGTARVLVSVKSLIEGIDVPDADVGISVASSSSVRQRIQSLGRVLRRRFDESAFRKEAAMHLLYVTDTVDELIYAKEDWGDLTGEASNRYWKWPIDTLIPEPRPGPPASPRPTEEQEWERLGRKAPSEPARWEGLLVGQEYTVDTMGTVTNASGTTIANPQGVADMVTAVRGRPGGRFRVTPSHRLILLSRGDQHSSGIFVAGQLSEPFEALADTPTPQQLSASVGLDDLVPGGIYTGPGSKSGGTFKLRKKGGGVIERSSPDGGWEFALTDETSSPQGKNAERVLDAWRSLFDRGMTFYVNELDHAWYTIGGERRFLAAVPGGFAWPSTREG